MIYEFEEREKEIIDLLVEIYEKVSDGISADEIMPLITEAVQTIQKIIQEVKGEKKAELIATIVKLATGTGLVIAEKELAKTETEN